MHWISAVLGFERRLKDISQEFSNLVVTTADHIGAAPKLIEEDHTLVHAAYYTATKVHRTNRRMIADRGVIGLLKLSRQK
jgi:hypothetical protein